MWLVSSGGNQTFTSVHEWIQWQRRRDAGASPWCSKKNTAFLSKCKDPHIKVPLCSAAMESHRLNHPTQSNLNGGGRLDLLFVIGALIQRNSRVQRREHAAFLQQRATPNSCILNSGAEPGSVLRCCRCSPRLSLCDLTKCSRGRQASWSTGWSDSGSLASWMFGPCSWGWGVSRTLSFEPG